MVQSKKSSFYESLINVLIGYFVALASQLVIFPFFGIYIPFETNFYIGAWFTLISIVRSYVVRRWFNCRITETAEFLAKDNGREAG